MWKRSWRRSRPTPPWFRCWTATRRRMPGSARLRGQRVVRLGVDHFGKSGDIPNLYRKYGLDADDILDACASAARVIGFCRCRQGCRTTVGSSREQIGPGAYARKMPWLKTLLAEPVSFLVGRKPA